MKPSIAAKLASLDARLTEIDSLLTEPEVVNDLDKLRKLSQERAEIQPLVQAYGEYRKAEGDIAAAEEMARDPEMRVFAEEELKSGRERLAVLEASLQRMLLPRDPNDDRNLFLESRAGTGGEASTVLPREPCRVAFPLAVGNRWYVGSVSEGPRGGRGATQVILG